METMVGTDVVPQRPWKEVCIDHVSISHIDLRDMTRIYGCHAAQIMAYVLAYPQEMIDRAYRHVPRHHPAVITTVVDDL
jgi:hypothetical protein